LATQLKLTMTCASKERKNNWLADERHFPFIADCTSAGAVLSFHRQGRLACWCSATAASGAAELVPAVLPQQAPHSGHLRRLHNRTGSEARDMDLAIGRTIVVRHQGSITSEGVPGWGYAS
jgi:hypothetical protein